MIVMILAVIHAHLALKSVRIWTDSEENLRRLLKELNGFHPNIKFTFCEIKEESLFLRCSRKIKNGD